MGFDPDYSMPTPTETQKPFIPGFEILLALAGLVVTSLLLRKIKILFLADLAVKFYYGTEFPQVLEEVGIRNGHDFGIQAFNLPEQSEQRKS